jgi:transcriptional regulator with XRE-family HTH domain
MPVTTYSSPLLAATQELVRNRPRSMTLAQLAAEVGVTRPWLNAFACGHMPNPSAKVVEKLFNRLSPTPLVSARVSEHTA